MFWIILILLVQTIRISIPYHLASVGGIFSERGGVINIALEGILLISAFSYVLGSWYSMKFLETYNLQNYAPIIGLISGILSGMIIGLLISFLCVTMKSAQILIGIAINLFAIGFTKFTNMLIFQSPSNSEWVMSFPTVTIFKYHPLEIFNIIFHPVIILTMIIIIISFVLLFKTRFGLRLRAVGEKPLSADFAGISVSFYRYCGVILGSAIAGLGGAWLALDQCRFAANMSAGRGYIALAAMIVGKWHPIKASAACLLFGFVEALQIYLQSKGFKLIPNQFIQMLPYVLTIIVLTGWVGKAIPPASDGIPYEKEK